MQEPRRSGDASAESSPQGSVPAPERQHCLPVSYSGGPRGHGRAPNPTAGRSAALETHVVKKYSNRKLYDTFTRRYVTLDVIADLLREGHEVRVVDRNTGEDITAVTLSQILVDMERHRRSPIPEPVLVDLVKERGEQLLGMVRASLTLPREIRQRAAGGIGRGAQTIEDRVDEAVAIGLHNLNIATHEDLLALERRVDDLTRRVDTLVAARAAASARRVRR